MRLVFISFLLLHFIFISGLGQSLKGVVKDNEDNSVLENVSISNLTLNKTVFSDKNGQYELPAHYGDSISVDVLAYEKLVFELKETGKQLVYRNFYLVRNEKLLDEFVVNQLTPYQQDSAARQSTYKKVLAVEKVKPKIHYYVVGLVIERPISFWLQYLVPKTRAAYKFQMKFSQWEKEKYCASKYDPETVSRLVSLTGDSLAYFMNSYPLDYNFARTGTENAIETWILTNYAEWKRNPSIIVLKPFSEN